jgi:putative endonuclease
MPAGRVESAMSKPETPYWLYLLECDGGTYYAGVAIDVEERFTRHVLGRGARYTRANQPLRVVAAREYPDKGSALSAEHALKQLPRASKMAFFELGETAAGQASRPAARPRQR